MLRMNKTRRKYYLRAITASCLLSLPTILVLGGFVFTEPVTLGDASIGAIFVVAAIVLLVFRHYKKIADARDYVEYIAKTREHSLTPPKRPASMKEMVYAIQELNESWAEANSQIRGFANTLENVFESVPDPLLMLDDGRRVIRANIAARTLLGANIQNRDLAAVIKDPWVLEATNMALSGGASRTVELSMTSAQNREFRVRVEPLMANTPDGAQAILSLHDITALRRTEKTMADFVANASHELKTPLSALIGFIETLQGPAKNDPAAHEKFLKIMYDQAHRMSRLVLDLLSLSRVELEEHNLPHDQVDIKNCLEVVAQSLEIKAAEKNVEIIQKTDDDLPVAVGDRDQLIQVFQNLADNALKYAPEGTQVELIAEVAKQLPLKFPSWEDVAIKVSIRDHGKGIPADAIPRLTERFYRVEAGKDQSVTGTGLGLAIVKHILSRHRGLLDIHSIEGQGSTFSAFLRGLSNDTTVNEGNDEDEGITTLSA